jgi:hypothetical protein
VSASRLDSDIDRLYQGALADFTAERNALAKRAGADASAIRALPKPSVPAWAINQLYWQKRPVYDQLLERADDLRATHQAALRGKRTDLRGAGEAHEEAVEEALKATLGLMAASGQPVTDATKQAIATTLRSLPGDEPPGRLSRPLQPRGFEMLAASTATHGQVRSAATALKPERGRPGDRVTDKDQAARAAKLAAARDAAAAAGRALRDAEHVARREEFEAARAVRDAEKAERRVGEAEEALRQAQSELTEARRAAAAAYKARDTAETRSAKAAEDVEAARVKERKAKTEAGGRGG